MTGPAVAPTPRAASAVGLRPAVMEIGYAFIRVARTRGYTLWVIGFPLIFYLVCAAAARHAPLARYWIASSSGMGLSAACVFGIGLDTARERIHGGLELQWASPMPRAAHLLGQLISSVTFALIVMGLLIGLGLTVGGVTVSAREAAGLALVLLAGSLPLAALGLLIGLLAPPSPRLITLLYLPLSLLSGFLMPVRWLPHGLQILARALPTFHLTALALAAFAAGPRANALIHWQVLAGFGVLMFAAAWITFVRFKARRQ